jgi:PAS domain-containing protein
MVVASMNENLVIEGSNSIWQHTFDAVPDLIFILDDQHRIVRANHAAAERLGFPPEWLVGQTCHRLPPPSPFTPQLPNPRRSSARSLGSLATNRA